MLQRRDSKLSNSLFMRCVAVSEVIVAFALVHLAFRSFKQFTSWGRLETETGLNFSPGLIMIVLSVIIVAVRRRSFTSYGVTRKSFLHNMNVGIVCLLALIAGGILLSLTGIRHSPSQIGPFEGSVFAVSAFAVTCAILWALNKHARVLRQVPMAVTLTLAVGFLLVPLVVGFWGDRPYGYVLLTVLWRLFCAGVGEEVFFRGYIQSRLNEAFGRPCRLLGVQFGMGLIVSSLLFGLVHALNSVDYFSGSYTFNWWYGLATVMFPYGFLREKTGSVGAPSVTHRLLDVLLVVPSLSSAP